MSKRTKRTRHIQQTPVSALYAAMAEGRLQGVRVWETINATHTPTAARLRGGGWKTPKG